MGTNAMDRVLEVLAARGMSRADFARAIGESSQNLNHWRRRGIPPAKIFEVARVLDVSVEWLRTGVQAEAIHLSTDAEAVAADWMQLNARTPAAARAMRRAIRELLSETDLP